MAADASIVSRAAIAGPFAGATLHPATPGFDRPGNLAKWADGPRITACFEELIEGVSVATSRPQHQATVRFANLDAANIRNTPLVDLQGPGRGLLKQQLDLVAAYADLRGDRSAEIIDQLTAPIGYWSAVLGLAAHRHKKTLQLIDIALALSVHIEMRIKHIFSVLRPVELSPQIQPMIPTPGHGSWPSGHATEAFTVATLLEAFMNRIRPGKHDGQHSQLQLQRLAARIAINRTVAGVHYPVDSACGRLLGTSLGEFLVARATGGSVHHRGFNADLFVEPDGSPRDFKLSDPLNVEPYSAGRTTIALPKAESLAWLWNEALKEWS